MSLEKELSSVLATPGVQSLIFEDNNTNKVTVTYNSHKFFSDWPHEDNEGTHKQQEEYFQNKFGVSWKLNEVLFGDNRGGASTQTAVFSR